MFRRKIQSYQKQEHTWWIRKWLTASAGNWETSSNGLSTTFVSASTITTSSKGIWRTFWKRKNGKMISRSTRNGSTPISIQSQRRTLCALRTRAEPNGWEDVQLTALQSTSHDDDDDDDEFEKCESKKKKTAFQLSSRQDTCSVPTGINDEWTPTRKGIGALKEKIQGDNRHVNTCSALHKDNLQVTRVI